jgi:hypothetical protein
VRVCDRSLLQDKSIHIPSLMGKFVGGVLCLAAGRCIPILIVLESSVYSADITLGCAEGRVGLEEYNPSP